MGAAAVGGPVDAYRGGQLGQSGPLGEPDQRQQPGIRDQVRLIERGGDVYCGVRGLHLRDALLLLRDEALDKPIIAGRKASLRSGASPTQTSAGGFGLSAPRTKRTGEVKRADRIAGSDR